MIETMTPPVVRDHSDELREQGYCIIRGALPRETIAALDQDLAGDFARTPFCEGAFYGATTKRFGRLLIRSKCAAALVRHPGILATVEKLLSPWCDRIQLNVAQAIGIHPGAPAQMPHRDQKRGSHAPAPPSWRSARLTGSRRYASRSGEGQALGRVAEGSSRKFVPNG